MPWGQGDTPIADVLQVLKKNRWAIPVGHRVRVPGPARLHVGRGDREVRAVREGGARRVADWPRFRGLLTIRPVRRSCRSSALLLEQFNGAEELL